MRDLPFINNRINELTNRLGGISLNHPYYEEENPNGPTVFSIEEAYSWLTLPTYNAIANEMGVGKKKAAEIFKAFWPACSLALFTSNAQGRVAFKKNVRAITSYRLMLSKELSNG